MDTLLSRWASLVPSRVVASDSAASISWPSRDAALVPVFLAHGLAPQSVLAIRRPGHSSRSGGSGVLAPWTSHLSSAYLADPFVLPEFRGTGAGGSLVRHVHEELDAAGFDAILLHYLGMNALSDPFWHRCGYRPLTATWEVRPATHLR